TEVPLLTPWRDRSLRKGDTDPDPTGPVLAEDQPADDTGIDRREAPAKGLGHPATGAAAPDRAGVTVPPQTPAAPEAVGVKPEVRDAPRDGKADDLTKIRGVGPKLEALLNRLGVFHFDQIAEWTADEVAWMDENLEGFRGRVTRDHWVDQARQLAAGGETEFSARVKKGDVD
ncbi:MAG: NADH-quinone oxidoreductase subunit E, partial [Paracoccaceae bacterium]